MNIVPDSRVGSYRQGTLAATVSAGRIREVLGFGPNVQDDPDKVTMSWGFRVDGVECAIWDYKGSAFWSFYGPAAVFKALFGAENVLS